MWWLKGVRFYACYVNIEDMVDIVNISFFTDVVAVDGQKMVHCVYMWSYTAN